MPLHALYVKNPKCDQAVPPDQRGGLPFSLELTAGFRPAVG